jgi:hypothetical protein
MPSSPVQPIVEEDRDGADATETVAEADGLPPPVPTLTVPKPKGAPQ